MRLHFLTFLFTLLWLALAQGSHGNPANGNSNNNNNNNNNCQEVFRKRDCDEPIGLLDEELWDAGLDLFPVDTEDAQDPNDPSLESRDLSGLLTDDEFDDPNLNRLLSRDILERLDNGEDPNLLVERILTDTTSSLDIDARLDTYHGLTGRLEERAAYHWEPKRIGLDKLLKKHGYYKICNGEGDLVYKTPPYALGEVLYDNENWGQCTNYELKKGGKPSKKRKPRKTKGTGYIAEHILERQMLQQFYHEKLAGQTHPTMRRTYCEHMSQFWEVEQVSGGGSIDVVIPDHTVTKNPNMPPLYLVGRAWPQTRAHGVEMVRTEAYINAVKARVFNSKSSVHAEEHFKMDTLKKVEEGHALFKVSVLVGKYLAHEDIQKIYKVQGERVGAAWKTAEDELEKYWANKPEPYERLDLDILWLDWLGPYTEKVHKKLWDDIKKWDGKFEKEIDEGRKVIRRGRRDTTLTVAQRKQLDEHEALLKDLEAARQEVAKLALNPAPQLFGNPWATAP